MTYLRQLQYNKDALFMTQHCSPTMRAQRTRGRRIARGFTLIELLVVLAILTMLAGLVGPKVLGQLGDGFGG